MPKKINSKLESTCAASGVVFVSEQSYKDFIGFYGTDVLEGKEIRVIGHGTRKEVKDGITSICKDKLSGGAKRILYVGERSGYKCFERFIDAVGRMEVLEEKIEVIVVGKRFSDKELAMISAYGAKEKARVVVLEDVSDYELGRLYASSDALCYPSEMEGFGLPVLEAMTAGTPVICQALPCIKEFAGDYPYYWDGKSSIQLARLLKLVVGSELKRTVVKASWTSRTIENVRDDFMSLINELAS